MSAETWIVIGGVFHVLMAVFHLVFRRLLRWDEELAKLTSVNRAVMKILNLCLMFAFLLFAYLSLVHPLELRTTALGRSLAWGIAAFWLFRAALQVVYLNPLRRPVLLALFVVFLAGAALYAVPLALG